MSPEDVKFQQLLAAHNYTPPTTTAAPAAPTTSWYDKLKKAQPAPKPSIIDTTKSALGAVRDTANAGVETMRANIKALQAGPQMDANAVKEAASGTENTPANAPFHFNKQLDNQKASAGLAEAGAQVVKAGEKGVAQLGNVVGGAASVPLSPVIAAGNAIGDKIGQAVPLKAADAIENTIKSHPVVADNATDIASMANLAAPEVAKKTAPLVDAGTAKVSAVAGKVKEAVKPKISTPEEVRANEAQIKQEMDAREKVKVQAGIDKSTKRWADAPAPLKAREILTENNKDGFDTHKFLSEIGVHLNDLPKNKGTNNLVTEEIAGELRNYGGKLSRDTLRPVLEELDKDRGRKPTPIADAVGVATTLLEHDKTIPFDDIEKISNLIQEKGDALARKYAASDESLNLTQMHDEKITYSGKGGYKPNGSDLDNNTSVANKYLARAFQNIVETVVPEGVDVSGMNDYFSKFYKAADYLDAINGKKAPVSTVSELANRGAKVGGAIVGHAVGGGVLPGVGGYIMGGILEHAVENLIKSGHGDFLMNIQHSNPEAFAKAQERIQKMTDERAGRLKLPEGKPLGSPENPWIMGQGPESKYSTSPGANFRAPDKSAAESAPAGKYPGSHRNADTGRFDKASHQGEGPLNK